MSFYFFASFSFAFIKQLQYLVQLVPHPLGCLGVHGNSNLGVPYNGVPDHPLFRNFFPETSVFVHLMSNAAWYWLALSKKTDGQTALSGQREERTIRVHHTKLTALQVIKIN